MVDYRKIYLDFHGKIPVDNDGRTYEIHHINGDHEDNRITNLKAVTIKEHFDIHYGNGDYNACLIMSDRMNITIEEKSKLASDAAKLRVENGTHHWKTEKYSKSQQIHAKVFNTTRVKNGTHPWLSGNRSENISKHMTEKVTCPHCNFVGSKPNMLRWHYDNCKKVVGGKLSRSSRYRRTGSTMEVNV